MPEIVPVSFRATSWRSAGLTIWYRSNTARVLCPVTFMATRSGTPAFTMFRTAGRRRGFALASLAIVGGWLVAAWQVIPSVRTELPSGWLDSRVRPG